LKGFGRITLKEKINLGFMKKLCVFVLFVPLAIAMAGAYGAVHNQISYTVSPEYFTKFKFHRFGLADDPRPERIRASIVGYHASKGMGLPIGLLGGAAGFIHRGYRRRAKVTLLSLVVVVAFTMLFGLGGLLYGFWQTRSIDLAGYANWFIPPDVTDLRRYLCAGYMHNAAYLGGGLSILVAWTFHMVVKARTNDPGEETAESQGA
jgi:hypothetical protein